MHRHSWSEDLDDDVPLQELAGHATPAAAGSSSKEWLPLSPKEMGSGDARQETHRLLDDQLEGVPNEVIIENGLTNFQLAGLYTSHTLSMWNSRSYEFAAVLFTASAYPHTLTIASLRGLSANLASLLFSPAVGRWCNRHPSRLWTLQVCIVLQRACICIACLGWAVIVQAKGVDQKRHGTDEDAPPSWLKHATLALLLSLGMIEKLSWVGNLIVMERDWVPLLANSTSKPALHVLNASIKRIDLISKLVAPLAISAIALGVNSLRITALLIAAMQLVTIGPELLTAIKVYQSCATLQSPRTKLHEVAPISVRQHVPVVNQLATWLTVLRRYMKSTVFLPSVAWASQPLSVLTLSASMTVYLLAANFPLDLITMARTFSTAVEIFSTILTPLLISWSRRRQARRTPSSDDDLQPLITVGLFGLSWQLLTLVPAVIALVALPSGTSNPASSSAMLTGVLLVFLALSRLGPFAYTLVEQQLVQVAVPADRRVEFSGTEMAIVAFAELSRWGLTGIFGKPEQFKGVALVSFGTILLAAAMFAWWTRTWKARLYATRVE